MMECSIQQFFKDFRVVSFNRVNLTTNYAQLYYPDGYTLTLLALQPIRR
jgi:hypothetical protein